MLVMLKVGVLLIVYNNKFNSRYMVFYNDGFILYIKMNIYFVKVKEIKDNLVVYVLLGYNDIINCSFVEMEVIIEIVIE